jgi:hypothetical protein
VRGFGRDLGGFSLGGNGGFMFGAQCNNTGLKAVPTAPERGGLVFGGGVLLIIHDGQAVKNVRQLFVRGGKISFGALNLASNGFAGDLLRFRENGGKDVHGVSLDVGASKLGARPEPVVESNVLDVRCECEIVGHAVACEKLCVFEGLSRGGEVGGCFLRLADQF